MQVVGRIWPLSCSLLTFVLDCDLWGCAQGRLLVQRLTPSTDNQWARAFMDGGKGSVQK